MSLAQTLRSNRYRLHQSVLGLSIATLFLVSGCADAAAPLNAKTPEEIAALIAVGLEPGEYKVEGAVFVIKKADGPQTRFTVAGGQTVSQLRDVMSFAVTKDQCRFLIERTETDINFTTKFVFDLTALTSATITDTSPRQASIEMTGAKMYECGRRDDVAACLAANSQREQAINESMFWASGFRVGEDRQKRLTDAVAYLKTSQCGATK